LGAQAAETLRGLGLSASFTPLDVCEPAQSLALVDTLAKERGPVDVWVNNPGGLIQSVLAESYPREAWAETLASVLSGPFYCSQAVGRHMLQQGRGVVINVVSVEGFRPVEGHVSHSTASAGLIMLTQALGIEWAKQGVRVVGVAVNVETDAGAREKGTVGIAYEQGLQRRTPLHRRGSLEELSEAVFYLASDAAQYIVAETLRVDGGWLAYQLF
jgi:2-deoxy-D-gluconate 3-dehydrogenase